jgi:hypothetical protein
VRFGGSRLFRAARGVNLQSLTFETAMDALTWAKSGVLPSFPNRGI